MHNRNSNIIEAASRRKFHPKYGYITAFYGQMLNVGPALIWKFIENDTLDLASASLLLYGCLRLDAQMLRTLRAFVKIFFTLSTLCQNHSILPLSHITGSGSEFVTLLRITQVSKPVGISGWKFYRIFFRHLFTYDYEICTV